MRRAARTDGNQTEIVSALRAIGIKGELTGETCPVCTFPLRFGDKGIAQKYCSRQCVGRAVGLDGNARKRDALREAVCAYCKTEFSSYYDNRKFCSRTCMGLQRSVDGTTKMRRFSARVDDNQAGVVDALRKIGASVLDCSSLGKGFPDLIVGFRGVNHLMEIKNPKNSYGRKGLNKIQQLWADKWPAPVYVVHTAEQAIAILMGETA